MYHLILTPAIARSAGIDAGNRSMRAHGRTEWNEDDWNAACAETARLLAVLREPDLVVPIYDDDDDDDPGGPDEG